jgi:hypothetical protein
MKYVWYNAKLDEIKDIEYLGHLLLKVYEHNKSELIYLGTL